MKSNYVGGERSLKLANEARIPLMKSPLKSGASMAVHSDVVQTLVHLQWLRPNPSLAAPELKV